MSRRLQEVGAVTALVLLLGAATAAAQTAASSPAGAAPLKVAITPLFAPPGDVAANEIAKSATSALTLMLRLAGSFTVVEAPNLDPIMGLPQAVSFYGRIGVRFGVFGTVTPDASGSYTITVQYWQSTSPTARPATFTRSVSSVSGAVAAADELAAKVASAASNRPLAIGTVEVKNTAGLPDYSIYVDGHLAAHNSSRLRLLSGKRTLTVEVPVNGQNRPLESFPIEVQAGKTVTVTLHSTTPGAPIVAHAAPEGSAAQQTPTNRGPGSTLIVTSSPDGATVILDGKKVGGTPLTIRNVSAGSHRLQLVHALFLPVTKQVRIAAHEQRELNVPLTVNRRDPAVATRLVSPVGTGGSSLLWSGMQVARFLGVLKVATTAPAATSSFLASRTVASSQGPSLENYLDLDLNLALSRIGNRLADNPTLTSIGDVWAATAAVAGTVGLIASQKSKTSQASQTWMGVAEGAAALAVGGMIFDAGTSSLDSSAANQRLLAYISSHGVLPPARRQPVLPAHRVILETGGDSLVRVGFLQSLVPSYLSFEESVGVGMVASTSFEPMLTGSALVSYTPWGAKTGHLRPALFAGLRATTNFSNSGSTFEPEFGTGNDWVGRYFDIFTRGGLGYNLADSHWDEFFTIGTRIF